VSWGAPRKASRCSPRFRPSPNGWARSWTSTESYGSVEKLAPPAGGWPTWSRCSGLALDFALVSLDLSLVLLRLGTLARGRRLWQAGAPADPGLLNETWLPWIEAALYKDQRRFSEAVERINEAQRFNLLEDLCQLGRAEEAAPRLAEVRILAERLGEPLDLARVVWLSGKVDAGLGRTAEARAAFEQVRQELRHHQLAYDAALVHLDLSLLLLDEGRTGEVRQIAEEMLWIFNAQGVQREALAALRVFYEAARRETATAELARRVFRFLRRAELDPELRFAEEGDEAS
jgi:tetratricopeptide (TPR) repeat protein